MRLFSLCLTLSTAFYVFTSPGAAVTIDWVAVGDPGNGCDMQSQGCFGFVQGSYVISKTEVTNAQYTEFLNAVATTDKNGLYNTNMGTAPTGGITRSQSTTSLEYTYTATRGNHPVNYVSFYDALRFANWMHNGQPMGLQVNGSTEAGAYTITAAGITANSITREEGATIFLTSENEWYKAAYYDPVSNGYFDFPAGTDTATVCGAPGNIANTANCNQVVFSLGAVGAYTASASPFGTFDQGGNLWEWNETAFGVGARGHRGGSFQNNADTLEASLQGMAAPSIEQPGIGFRIASIPEPGTRLLLLTGLLGLAIYRRGRAKR